MSIGQISLSNLHWELEVLCRAVTYPNLSGASMHIGISQPQLSRIIAKIEAELKITLLDRSAKRKSGWTPTAQKLAEVYQKSERKFEQDIRELIIGAPLSSVRLGTLEGLILLANQAGNQVLSNPQIKLVNIDVYDLDELERLFIKNDLDVIFTIREPSKRKYKHSRKLGYQSLDWNEKDSKMLVMSSFEHQSKTFKKWKVQSDRIVVSNSLTVRKEWFKKYGGSGIIPSEQLKDKASKQEEETVYMFGSEELSPMIWDMLKSFSFQLK